MLKDEVEAQIGYHFNFILPLGFHTHKQLRVSIMFAAEENDQAKRLLCFYGKARTSRFYIICHLSPTGEG